MTGGEISISNLIPNIGLKLRASRLLYEPRFVVYFDEIIEYEYIPLTLCTSFNLLPFLKLQWLKLSLETGIGVYFWKGLDNSGQIIISPTGETMEERDIGFVGGFTLQLRPIKYIGIEFSSLYHYIASSEIYKYGFEDKDEKIWENGIGLKVIIPLARRKRCL